jgi:hypothetical protein
VTEACVDLDGVLNDYHGEFDAASLALRLGLADMAAQSLAGTAGGARFASLRNNYAERLRRQL